MCGEVKKMAVKTFNFFGIKKIKLEKMAGNSWFSRLFSKLVGCSEFLLR